MHTMDISTYTDTLPYIPIVLDGISHGFPSFPMIFCLANGRHGTGPDGRAGSLPRDIHLDATVDACSCIDLVIIHLVIQGLVHDPILQGSNNGENSG